MKKLIALLMALSLLAFGYAIAESTPATVAITFVENPTTGFTWTWTVESGAKTAPVEMVDNGYTGAANTEGMEGVGGTHSWTLTGKAEGDATVTFVYGQAWEGGEVADTIVYTVHVDKDLNVTVTDVTGLPDQYDPKKGVVQLLENPTTGYTWAFTASNENVLKLDWDQFVAAETAEGKEAVAGAGGVHVWSFSGMAEGDVTLTYGYAQSWEEGVEPEATVTYAFHVDKDLNVTLGDVGGDYADYDPQLALTDE